jgi:hypothetical protein
MVRQFADQIEGDIRFCLEIPDRLRRMLDKTASGIGIIAAAAKIVEIGLRLLVGVFDALGVSEIVVSGPDETVGPDGVAAQVVMLAPSP